MLKDILQFLSSMNIDKNAIRMVCTYLFWMILDRAKYLHSIVIQEAWHVFILMLYLCSSIKGVSQASGVVESVSKSIKGQVLLQIFEKKDLL